MPKKIPFYFLIIVICFSFLGCSGKNTNSSSNNKKAKNIVQKLTIDDIKKNYIEDGEKKIENISTYSHYTLVEYTLDSTTKCFDWYNLETGDKDVLLTDSINTTLKNIENENSILFITDGISHINGHKYFPKVIKCRRIEENTACENDFDLISDNLYLEIDKKVEIGVKTNETISDIKVSLKGIEILFEPMKGYEGEFYAAYTTIPEIETTYVKDKQQFIIEFKNTNLNPTINKSKIAQQNHYISSVDINMYGKNTKLIVNLKDTAKYYTAFLRHLEPQKDDFPYVDFNFANEYKIE